VRRNPGAADQCAPGVRAPWTTGLVLFLVLAAAGGAYLARPHGDPSAPRSVLDARRDSTAAAARAVGRSLNGGLNGLAEIATVVDESMRQHDRPLLDPFQHRRWRSLYLVDRTHRAVVAQVGETAGPGVLDRPAPDIAGMRLAGVGSARRIVQYTPVGARYLLVGQLDPARLRELLAPAGPDGAWLLDRTGTVIIGPGAPPANGDEGTAGSTARRTGERTEVVAWAPVDAAAPSDTLGWTVVSSRATVETTPPVGEYRGRAVALAAGLGALTVIVFGLLHVLVLRPVRRLARAGSGEPQGATAPRHGEAGHVATALNRLRQRTGRR
jgi:HAMP domain-containing protein